MRLMESMSSLEWTFRLCWQKGGLLGEGVQKHTCNRHTQARTLCIAQGVLKTPEPGLSLTAGSFKVFGVI